MCIRDRNASLPSIQADLGSNINQLQWTMAGFGLLFCSFLVIMGRLGDIYGRKKFLIYSLIGFSIASIGAGLANTPNFLIFTRMLQGFFGAAILPCGTALTANEFPNEEQGRALGIYGSLVGIGIGFGPIIGGIIDTTLNWRWIFFINVPIIFISLMLCLPTVTESKLAHKVKVDWLGAIFLALCLGGLTFTISEVSVYGLNSPAIAASVLITLFSFLLLMFYEKKSATPIIPLKLFRNSKFLLATIIYAGAVAFHWPVLFLMPIYLHNIAGYNSEYTSLLLASMTLMTIISPILAGYFYDKKSKTLSIHLIFILNIISLILFFQLNENGLLLIILPSFILFGLAWGIGNGIATPVALSGLSNNDDAGVVSGALTTILNIFTVLSLSASVAIFQYVEKFKFIKKASLILPNETINTITMQPGGDIAKKILSTVPTAMSGEILNIYRESFIYGINITYILILILTAVCWMLAKSLLKKSPI